MKVFLAEDDPVIVEGLKVALSQEGYEVESCGTVREALDAITERDDRKVHADVYLLDVNLPDGDGYSICRAIRERSQAPVIFLTACDDEIHTVLAFEQGADDYIAKPFRIRELIARMRAVLRRSMPVSGSSTPAGDADRICIGRNELDIRSGKVYRDGEEVFLSSVEYRLLLTFVRGRGRLLTRQQILTDMWDSAGDYVNDNTLTVYVRRLRKKLEGEDGAVLIETVRGIGYRME